MNFRSHSAQLTGMHAFLSPSNYHWVNYDDDKFDRVFVESLAARKGQELHKFAHDAIRLGVKLPNLRKTLNLYVNDGIGYRMSTEQILFYSENCFGTTDAICFRKKLLRVHDLKNGLIPASPTQLEVYAALFCLEYNQRPFDIQIELRLYQNDEVSIFEGDPDKIMHIMDRIVSFDKRIREMRMEAEL